jgi:hypothetical protein
MTLREIAAAILAGSGEVSRYVSRPDAGGVCRTIWPGVTILTGQYYELLRLCRRTDESAAMRAHDRAVARHI